MQSPVDGLWLSPELRHAAHPQATVAQAASEQSAGDSLGEVTRAPGAVTASSSMAQRFRAVGLYCFLGALLTALSWTYARPGYLEDLSPSAWPQRVLNFLPPLSQGAANESVGTKTEDEFSVTAPTPETGDLAALLNSNRAEMQALQQANIMLLQRVSQLQALVEDQAGKPQKRLDAASFLQPRKSVALQTTSLSSR